jgi:uncharacterized protein (DUF2141 family)
MKRITLLIINALVLMFLAACSEQATESMPVTLNLTIETPHTAAPSGTVHVYTYNAQRGEDLLRHSLAAIEEKLSFDYDGGKISHNFEYVPGSGSGFAVYAFLDTNGDGALCTPTEKNEFSGLTVVDSEPSGVVNLAVQLAEPCADPGLFYPK